MFEKIVIFALILGTPIQYFCQKIVAHRNHRMTQNFGPQFTYLSQQIKQIPQ